MGSIGYCTHSTFRQIRFHITLLPSLCSPETGQAYEVVTDLHLSHSHSAAASWVVTGQSQSLVLPLSSSLEETGRILMLLSSVPFSLEATGQNLNHACSEPSLLVVSDENRVNVFYLIMMSLAFFCRGINLTIKEMKCLVKLLYNETLEPKVLFSCGRN